MPLSAGVAVCEIHLGNQNVLCKMASCIAVWPENAGPGPFPASYLSDDHTAWTRRTSLERYVEGLPMIVVMLDGRRGWYTDSSVEPRGAFETFILRGPGRLRGPDVPDAGGLRRTGDRGTVDGRMRRGEAGVEISGGVLRAGGAAGAGAKAGVAD